MHQARRRAKAQQRALLTLELAGFVALPLPTVTQTLTVPIEREVGAQVADALREALRERHALKAEVISCAAMGAKTTTGEPKLVLNQLPGTQPLRCQRGNLALFRSSQWSRKAN